MRHVWETCSARWNQAPYGVIQAHLTDRPALSQTGEPVALWEVLSG